jgi:hypothetical protein
MMIMIMTTMMMGYEYEKGTIWWGGSIGNGERKK